MVKKSEVRAVAITGDPRRAAVVARNGGAHTEIRFAIGEYFWGIERKRTLLAREKKR